MILFYFHTREFIRKERCLCCATNVRYVVAADVKYVVAPIPSWNKSICNPEMGTKKIRGPLKNTVSYQI
jgi:hypothetical protein